MDSFREQLKSDRPALIRLTSAVVSTAVSTAHAFARLAGVFNGMGEAFAAHLAQFGPFEDEDEDEEGWE